MAKKVFSFIALFVFVSALGCGVLWVRHVSATEKPGDGAEQQSAAALPLRSFSQDFEDFAALTGQGWTFQNNSEPLGLTNWYAGVSSVFPAHSGSEGSYAAANFNNTSGTGTISNWMLTPELGFENGDTLTFWSRAANTLPDRLEVRLSTNASSTDVGTTAASVGDFDTLLLTVNESLAVGGYPQTWTRYQIVLSGVSGQTGRIAFRYHVTNAGPDADNAGYIGIDSINLIQAFLPIIRTSDPPAAWTIDNSAKGDLYVVLHGVGSHTFPQGTSTWTNIYVATGTYDFTVTVRGGPCNGQSLSDSVYLSSGGTAYKSYTCD